MLKKYYLENGKVVPDPGDHDQISVYVNLDEDDMKFLIESYHLNEHTLISTQDPDELARLEFESDYVALIIKRPQNFSNLAELDYRIGSLGFFLFKNRVIIITNEENSLFESRQFSNLKSVNDVVIKLIARSVHRFLMHLRLISTTYNDLEVKIGVSAKRKHFHQLFVLGKSLVYYLDAIQSNSAFIEKMKTHASKIRLTPDQIEYLDEILIDNNQCHRQAEIFSNVLAHLMDTRSTIEANTLNKMMERLTIISVVFLPLNVLAGIGGMSEYSMMTHNFPWPIAYLIFVLFLILIGLITYTFVRRMEKRSMEM